MAPNHRYNALRYFANKSDFSQWWTAEKVNWRYLYASSGMDNHSAVKYWHCSFAKRKGYNCKSRLRVCQRLHDGSVSVEIREVPHDHTRSADASTFRKRRDVDTDSDTENAGPGAGDADPFGIDPAERAEAERFLKEQERLEERLRKKLGASPTANQSTSMPTADSLDLGALNARLAARNTTRKLSFGDDVPSSDNWEMQSAAARDIVPDGDADQDQLQFEERDSSGRFSVSTFGSGSTRSTFYRDSPSPTRTSVREDLVAAAELKAPVNKLRFDNDSSDGEAEEPSPASAVSYEAYEAQY